MATMYTGCNRMDTKSFYRGDEDLIIKDNDLISIGKAELFGRVFQVRLTFIWPSMTLSISRDQFKSWESLETLMPQVIISVMLNYSMVPVTVTGTTKTNPTKTTPSNGMWVFLNHFSSQLFIIYFHYLFIINMYLDNVKTWHSIMSRYWRHCSRFVHFASIHTF